MVNVTVPNEADDDEHRVERKQRQSLQTARILLSSQILGVLRQEDGKLKPGLHSEFKASLGNK